MTSDNRLLPPNDDGSLPVASFEVRRLLTTFIQPDTYANKEIASLFSMAVFPLLPDVTENDDDVHEPIQDVETVALTESRINRKRTRAFNHRQGYYANVCQLGGSSKLHIRTNHHCRKREETKT